MSLKNLINKGGQHLYCISNTASDVRLNTLSHFDNDIPEGFLNADYHYEIALEMLGFNQKNLTAKYIGIECSEIEPVINTTTYDQLLRIIALNDSTSSTNNYAYHEFKKKLYFKLSNKVTPRITLRLTNIDGTTLKLETGQATVTRLHIRRVMEQDEKFALRVMSNATQGTHTSFTANLPRTLELPGKWKVALTALSHPIPLQGVVVNDSSNIKFLSVPHYYKRSSTHNRYNFEVKVKRGMLYDDMIAEITRSLARYVFPKDAEEVSAIRNSEGEYIVQSGIHFTKKGGDQYTIKFAKNVWLRTYENFHLDKLGWPQYETWFLKPTYEKLKRWGYMGVAGTEITYDRPWERSADDFTVNLRWDLEVDEINVPLPDDRLLGNSTQIKTKYNTALVERITSVFDGTVELWHHDKLALKCHKESLLGIWMHTSLEMGRKLGFNPTPKDVKAGLFTHPFAPNHFVLARRKMGGLSTFKPNLGFMYCNITKPVLIGSHYANLLRVFDIPNQTSGIITHEFDPPDQIVVEHTIINDITVQIARHDGHPLYFKDADASVILSLEFEKIQ